MDGIGAVELGLHGPPRIRTATWASIDDAGFPTRYLGDHYALHVHGYPGRVRIGDRTVGFGQGDVTLTPRRVPSWYDVDGGGGSHLVVHFLPADGQATVPLAVHHRLGRDASAAASMIERIVFQHRVAGREPLAGLASSVGLQNLLLWLATRPAAAAGTGRADIREAVEATARFLDLHLDRPLAVGQLAERVGVSQNLLARQFRRVHGVTMHRYLLDRRLALARELLVGTDLPVGEIGRRIGIADPHYFNKRFRAVEGTSPSAYRARKRVG
ncbi:MAG: AraC family transcriptional regulator [Actinomycetota bacterium]